MNIEEPVLIDQDRMNKALVGPFFTIPDGLTPNGIVEYFRGNLHVVTYEAELCKHNQEEPNEDFN